MKARNRAPPVLATERDVALKDANPLLVTKMPDIFGELSGHSIEATRIARDAEVVVRDLFTHLSFEIQKMDLRISQLQWKDRLNKDERTELETLERQSAYVKSVVEKLPVEDVAATSDYLNGLIDELVSMFPNEAGPLSGTRISKSGD